ncbi:cell wall-binding repeat-containing protein [Peptacetobacter sp. AB845]|uniref:cell wall-binding repeat-containing protein n=1 Tax=Peptacetobacter sp. AB845 TaxID=3388429 RepID=UPI0039C972F2
MNKKKSKALAFLLAASLLIPSVDGVVSAAELSKDNVKPVSKIEESQEVAPEQNNTNQEGTGENLDTQNPVTQNVAKIGDVQYTSLIGDEGAIAKAKDGDVIELLADVTEDITLDKNITIDGKNNYGIKGSMDITNGSISNVKLVQDGEKHLLNLGSKNKDNKINLTNVTFEYGVDADIKNVAVHIIEDNDADIKIEKCLFTNDANNGSEISNVKKWSFGIYMGNQNENAEFKFINNHFEGTFRTMLANLNGKCIVEGNIFENTVFSVKKKYHDKGEIKILENDETTCITVPKDNLKSYTDISIRRNNINNSGALYFGRSENVVVENNNIDYSLFQHYIQVGGLSKVDLDIRNNNFNLGKNKIVAVDTDNAIVRFPDNMKVLNYWAWRDTEENIRPSDYSSYVYSYNEDGSKTFYPESEAALKAFTNPAIGNIGAEKNDKIVISKDMKIGDRTGLDIGKEQEITIIIPRGIKLELESNSGDKGAINVSGKLNISGEGNLVVGKNASLNTDEGSEVNMSDISLQNNGNLDLDGKVIFDNVAFSGNKPEGDGNIEYIYTPSKPINPTYDHTRIIGSDRYETAGKIADKLGSYDTAVLVNATSTMSDGLSAAGLAGKEDAAILLVKKDSIPKATMDRLSKVKKVYIIGGENAISQKVINQLKKNNVKVNVERLGGKTRVETSELVAKEIGSYKKAFVVNGFKGEADAMSASSVAAREEAPILLTNGKSSSTDRQSGVSYYVVGGKSVMNDSIVKKYKAERIAGDDRYETNREMINEFYGASETLYFANGETLVDALTASTIAKDDGLVLVGRKSDNKILNKKNTIQVGGMKFDVDFEK